MRCGFGEGCGSCKLADVNRETVLTWRFVAMVHAFCIAFAIPSWSQSVPNPSLDPTSWVLLEFWPDVEDITVSAYFLEGSSARNENLCMATKRVFDREQEARSKALGREFTSYRVCLPVSKARAEGYIRAE